MPAPTTTDELLDLVRKSGVVDEKRLGAYVDRVRAGSGWPSEPGKLAGLLVRDGLLTHFQAEQILQGKWRRFTIGKYKVLERLGSGGMGSVYLCEHKLMRRRVAVKVLPTAKAEDPASLERFYREARAVAALDHPNIVRAYDIDQDEKLHFLVMEYVDGASLQEIVKKTGRPLDVARAAHYMRQAALGLQHAHETAGLVHRDIKPGNILVDRTGGVKILDMGLARFFHDEEDILTRKYDENILGTADYLAPEQALDSHTVDIRADIYSLGATFYFCLTGRPPFNEGTVAQKLIWHQTRRPRPIRQIRPEVPEGLAVLIDKMMAKDPAQRPQIPLAIAEALAPWTATPIGPPPGEEMPQMSPAALGLPGGESGTFPAEGASSPGTSSSTRRRAWQLTPPSGPAPVTVGVPGVPPSSSGSSPSSPQPPLPSTGSGAAGPGGVESEGILRPDSQRSPRPESAVVATPPDLHVEEEPFPWEPLLASDTNELAAQLDTPSISRRAGTSTSSRRTGGASAVFAAHASRWLWWALAVILILALLAGALAAAYWFFNPTVEVPSPTQKVLVPRTFKVGKNNRFHTVQEALAHVGPNDRILLQDQIITEDLLVDARSERLKQITIESEDPTRWVIWRPKSKNPSYLAVLNNIEGWQLQGITFDGQDRCSSGVVLISGRCPGATLDNIQLVGFKKKGLVFINCEGETTRPATLWRMVITAPTGGEPADCAVSFGLDKTIISASSNRNIILRDSKFLGAYTKYLEVQPSAVGKTIVEMHGVTAQPSPEQPAVVITDLSR